MHLKGSPIALLTTELLVQEKFHNFLINTPVNTHNMHIIASLSVQLVR